MSRQHHSTESGRRVGPAQRPELPEVDRREFSRLMAASLALAGATTTGCRYWPEQHVVPRITREHHRPPGKAVWFASGFEFRGVVNGLLAKSLDGRPIKIEGNPEHPCSLGGTDVWMQSSILDLYDPIRSRHAIRRPVDRRESAVTGAAAARQMQVVDRSQAEAWLRDLLRQAETKGGRGLFVLTQPHSSLSLERLRRQIRMRFPEVSWHVYDPLDRDNEYQASRRVFGTPLRIDYDFSMFDTVVAFDADVLGLHPAHLKWSRQWADHRVPESPIYSQWICVESTWTTTGAAADRRIGLSPEKIEQLIFGLVDALNGTSTVSLPAELQSVVDTLVERLRRSRLALLAAGEGLSPEAIAAVAYLNHAINPNWKGFTFYEEPLAGAETSVESLQRLTAAIDEDRVETLLILGGNPVFDAPADLEFEQRLKTLAKRGKTTVHYSYYDDETSQQCQWHLPAAHYLEGWADGRGWDGTFTVGQPLIRPLFDGWTLLELHLLLAGSSDDPMSYLRETAASRYRVETDKAWRQLLHDGFAGDSAFATVRPEWQLAGPPQPSSPSTTERCIRFLADRKVYDGRFANNAWLQELPDPITKLTWGNAAQIGPVDARQLGLVDGDWIQILLEDDRSIELPVTILPGQAEGCIGVPLGYGRRSGHIAEGVGVDVQRIRTAGQRYWMPVGNVQRAGRRQRLPMTQEPFTTDEIARWGLQTRVGRQQQPGMLVREATWDAYRRDPKIIDRPVHVPEPAPMFDPPHDFSTPHAWGMSIDLNRCLGCNACVVACQAENNVPVVGPANVLQNREMHWLRIDRYFKGSPGAEAEVVHVPVACAHCEDAPCEQVCPVAATVHDTEGLNAMVYNRCVGTRYCANNCPYKVRRFNYFDYHASDPRAPARPWLDWPDKQTPEEVSELRQLGFNPDVTVRMRGVMEKCTYCVQRISAARIQARVEHQQRLRDSPNVREGEVVTACQQACPTQAIQFGDLNDPQSQVSQQHQGQRSYAMLEELNIKPRTRYLARIRNVPESDDHHSEPERNG
ncbi:MAG: 4Fe-4S dicluster domain-containing protein [Planctomycetota bacterium]|nr:MAG: 4Fe-4S dicluster domain-containing protein [Planctomycetota bacterium]